MIRKGFPPNRHLAFRERAFPRWANQVAARGSGSEFADCALAEQHIAPAIMSAEIVVRIAIWSFLPWKVRRRDYREIASAVTDLTEMEQASASSPG